MDTQPIEGAESTKPHKTWFIQRGDGFLFASREQEAWDLLKNRTNWMRSDFKIVGVSDGMTYHRVLREGKAQLPALQQEADAIQKEIGEYTKTEHRLKYEELADDTDERIVKIRSIKKGLESQLMVKLKEISDVTTNLEKKAFDAEFEVAKGNIEMPSNQDIITPGGRREEIIRNMPR